MTTLSAQLEPYYDMNICTYWSWRDRTCLDAWYSHCQECMKCASTLVQLAQKIAATHTELRIKEMAIQPVFNSHHDLPYADEFAKIGESVDLSNVWWSWFVHSLDPYNICVLTWSNRHSCSTWSKTQYVLHCTHSIMCAFFFGFILSFMRFVFCCYSIICEKWCCFCNTQTFVKTERLLHSITFEKL